MPVKPNTIVRIVEISSGTVKALREKGTFPEDLLQTVDRFCKEVCGGPEPVFLTLDSLEERLARFLPAAQRARLPEILQSISSPKALVREIPESDDFTFFIGRGSAQAREGSENGDAIEEFFGKVETFADGELWLWDDGASRAAYGRVLVCSCSKGTEWSITFRRQREIPSRERRSQFFNSFDDIADLLRGIIFDRDNADEHGLVVIAGRTGSGKSQVARKLIQHCIGIASRDQRTPHLVSFEDPIEKDFRQAGFGVTDVTQRQKPKDAASLADVLQNALRQTPKVLYVGETRNTDDWKLLLEFAGTGHLVITTSHAGSLVEAVGNILKETESSTPATRSIVADRLLAVIHMKTATEPTTKTSFLIPAIWHRTPLGIKALMAEGLSSLLPNTPPERPAGGRTSFPGSVGRYWFARELAKKASQGEISDRVKRTALEWDLEGL